MSNKYVTCEDWNKIDKVNTPEDYDVLTRILVPRNLYAMMNRLLCFEPDPDTIHPWRKPEKQKVHYADIYGSQ